MDSIAEWRDISYHQFQRDIVGSNRPAVLRHAFESWPVVEAARDSSSALVEYLKPLCTAGPVTALVADPALEGRFHYRHDLRAVNFQRGQTELTNALDKLLDLAEVERPKAISIQAVSVRNRLPDFELQNRQILLAEGVAPTLWIGNRGRVAPHFDIHDNLACVTAGARRFTLFPPQQTENLYPGPALLTPAGVPVSLVDLSSPDLVLYPRFAKALNAAQQALLEPGDEIYIPASWWHGVESLHAVNMLINYWWGGMANTEVSPYDSLLHSMLGIADLSDEMRAAWKSLFDYYVFKTDADPAEHLPDGFEDLVTGMNAQQTATLRHSLAQHLQRVSPQKN